MGGHLATLAIANSGKARTSARFVYVAMAIHSRDRQGPTPDDAPGVYRRGVDALAALCFPNATTKDGRRMVFRALAELEAAGMVTRIRERGPRDWQYYRLNLPGVSVD